MMDKDKAGGVEKIDFEPLPKIPMPTAFVLDKEALERLSLGGNLKPAAPDIMDVDQAAAYMGFAPRTIYNLAQAGEMPAAKVKGSWRFSKAALDAWIAELSQANMRKERD